MCYVVRLTKRSDGYRGSASNCSDLSSAILIINKNSNRSSNVPSIDETHDQVYMIVSRAIDKGTVTADASTDKLTLVHSSTHIFNLVTLAINERNTRSRNNF